MGNRMRRFVSGFLAVLWAATPAPSFAQASPPQPVAKSSLVADQTSIAPGKPFQAGLLLEAPNEWHTYWENPGDAGLATSITWTLPEGFTASTIHWPIPSRLVEGPLVVYGYEGSVLLPVTITPPANLPDGNTPIKIEASWLICKDICVPESAMLQIDLPKGEGAPSNAKSLFGNVGFPETTSTSGSYSAMGDKAYTLSLPFTAEQGNGIETVHYYPREMNMFIYTGDARFIWKQGKLETTLERSSAGPVSTKPTSGLLAVKYHGGKEVVYDTSFNSTSTGATAAAGKAGLISLPAILLAALLGGLILNLMPCVLPVLSLKALEVVGKVGSERSKVIPHGIAYTLGILLSFAGFAGVLISLQHAGEAVGWGYQMQSPGFVGFLIYLLFLVGLSLSGVFHLPVLFGSAATGQEHSLKGSFFTGVLATAVATPCTAPFMASAVGIALSLPAWEAMLIFEALGLGLALPFLLISVCPNLLKFLPKPGVWMETFKEFLAFPMYASVIWLLWVLTLQTGAGGVAVAGAGLLAIIIIIWMKRLFADGGMGYRIAAIVLFALMAAWSLNTLGNMELSSMSVPMNDMAEGEIVPYSKAKLDELKAAGKPVFIDVTAAWCLTCQVNGRTAIHTTRTLQAFKDNGITLMIADWTRRNTEITELLSGFGYQGVPLYVFYPASGGEPVILPQILTEDTVINTVKGKP